MLRRGIISPDPQNTAHLIKRLIEIERSHESFDEPLCPAHDARIPCVPWHKLWDWQVCKYDACDLNSSSATVSVLVRKLLKKGTQ